MDITVYGDGQQTRSFCYVDDMVDGMIRMMNAEDAFTGPVNLGNPDEYSILELANQIIELTQSKSKVVHAALPEDDPLQRNPNIELAKTRLDWIPGTLLEEGLKKTIAYFQQHV